MWSSSTSVLFRLLRVFLACSLLPQECSTATFLPREEHRQYSFHPFFLGDVFVTVVERKARSDDFEELTHESFNEYPFGEPDAFMLVFGDEGDREFVLAQNAENIHEEMLESRCTCSRTLALSLAYLDAFLIGDNVNYTECLSTILNWDESGDRVLEVFGADIMNKLFEITHLEMNHGNFGVNFLFVSIEIPQKLLLKELETNAAYDANFLVHSFRVGYDEKPNCSYHNSFIEALSVDFIFSSYLLPDCPYPISYCCFLKRNNFRDIAQNSKCVYHPIWISTSQEKILSNLVDDIFETQKNFRSIRNESRLLDISMTGKFFYVEEILDAMEQQGTVIRSSTQVGELKQYNDSSGLNQPTNFYNDKLKEENMSCYLHSTVGLIDFTDFGTDPVPFFRNLYIHIPAPENVVNVAHFASLDAMGSFFQNGELFVHFSPSTPPDEIGFRNVEGLLEPSIKIYFESSSFGLGLNDSRSLAPPLNIYAMKSPIPNLLMNVKVSSSLQQFSNKSLLRLTTHVKDENSPLRDCHCDHILSGVHYLLGVVNNPYYGHVLTNTVSNIFAMLFLKRIDPKTVTLHLQLERNGYHQVFEDKYFPLFYALGIQKIVVNDESSMLFSSKYLQKSEVYCLERVIVGAKPLLDNLNRTKSRETGRLASLPLWKHFASRVANAIVPAKLKRKYIDQNYWKSRQVKAPLTASTCAVTFISRHRYVDALHSRGIRNLETLQTIAHSHGCTSQTLFLHEMSIPDQIAQFRYNTSLLVGVDGTGLLNSVWMHECSSVLRINMWRKRGMVNKLSQGLWFEFTPSDSHTVLYPRNLTFDLDMNPTEESDVELFFRACGDLLNVIKDREYSDSSTFKDSKEHFNFSGAVPDMSDVMIEDFFREAQSSYVDPEIFRKILIRSETHRHQCMLRLYN